MVYGLSDKFGRTTTFDSGGHSLAGAADVDAKRLNRLKNYTGSCGRLPYTMRFGPAILAILGLFCTSVACGQQQREAFFSPVGTPFDPEISIVNTGIVSDMQVVVSPDNKYVTINARASNSRLLALREFTFQRPAPVGFVGTGGNADTAFGVAPTISILDRPGMTRLDSR